MYDADGQVVQLSANVANMPMTEKMAVTLAKVLRVHPCILLCAHHMGIRYLSLVPHLLTALHQASKHHDIAAAHAIMTVEDPLDRQRERERRRDKKLKRKVLLNLSLTGAFNHISNLL